MQHLNNYLIPCSLFPFYDTKSIYTEKSTVETLNPNKWFTGSQSYYNNHV